MVPVQFSDQPLAISPIAAKQVNQADENPVRRERLGSRKSDMWTTIGIIALILAGMLLGASITRLWIAHFSSGAGVHSL
jgi:hypothetical protein